MTTLREIKNAVKPFGYTVTGFWTEKQSNGEWVSIQYARMPLITRLTIKAPNLKAISLNSVLEKLLNKEEFALWNLCKKSDILLKELDHLPWVAQNKLSNKEVSDMTKHLDAQLKSTLKHMDENPALQKTIKMTPEEIEALPPDKREKLKNEVLAAVENAINKAKQETQVATATQEEKE